MMVCSHKCHACNTHQKCKEKRQVTMINELQKMADKSYDSMKPLNNLMQKY